MTEWRAPFFFHGPRDTSNQLVAFYGRSSAFRLDNGPELTAQVFVDWCNQQGIARYYIQPGKPAQNAFIERFNPDVSRGGP